MNREELIKKLAEQDYEVNWSDRSFVMDYLEDFYGKMSDEELAKAAEEVSLTDEEVAQIAEEKRVEDEAAGQPELVEPEDWASEILSRLERDDPEGIARPEAISEAIRVVMSDESDPLEWRQRVVAALEAYGQ